MNIRNKNVAILMTGTKAKGGINSYIKTITPKLYNRKYLYQFKLIFVHKNGGLLSNMIYFIQQLLCLFLQCFYWKINKKFVIVHVNTAKGGSFFRSFIIIMSVFFIVDKCILHIHSGEIHVFLEKLILKNFLGKRIVKILFNKTEKIIFVSNELRKLTISVLQKKGINIRNKAVVINNSISLETLVKNKKNYKEEIINILFLGRLINVKNPFAVIKVIQFLNKKTSKFHFYIAGDGPLFSSLEESIQNLKLNNITLLGWINEKEREYILKKSHILLVPSLYESFGLVVLEAYSFGLAVIATNVGGLKDILIDRINGIIVEINDYERMANQIFSLIKDRSKLKQFGGQNRKDVYKYSTLNILTAYDEIYKIKK